MKEYMLKQMHTRMHTTKLSNAKHTALISALAKKAPTHILIQMQHHRHACVLMFHFAQKATRVHI